jgi:hypothetical protein
MVPPPRGPGRSRTAAAAPFCQNFPTFVFGTSAMKTTSSGIHHEGNLSLRCARISSLASARKKGLGYWYLEDRLYQRKLRILRASA